MPLESIRSLIKPDLQATDQFICDQLRSEIPFINNVIQYILECGGKRIRPLVVLLSARAFNHADNHHVTLAAAIELIHTATLLHDDVVDHSTLRRGQQTANTVWGNEASILVGDFLYSRAFQLIVRTENPIVTHIFADATNLIAEGEVMQLLNTRNIDLTETDYFNVIGRKTGKLFEIASQIGPAISAAESEHLKTMQHYGAQLGIAYQLIDDALDYRASTKDTGKQIGNDLHEGKLTLPLIYALQHASASEKKLIREAIINESSEHLAAIIDIIESTQAIEYTARAAKQHSQQAIHSLSRIPESPYRQALQDLAEFVVERHY